MAASLLEVYPNPAATFSEVQVRVPNLEGVRGSMLAIYDSRGTLLAQMPVTEQLVKLEGVRLSAGFYNVVLTGPARQHLHTQRLVVTGQ